MRFYQIFFNVEQLKRMIGMVAGLFCTLLVAGLCSFCFKPDFVWYFALNKPSFVLSGGWFTVLVTLSYISTVLSISRLVEHKHIFPPMVFFVLLGASCVLFVFAFFDLKNLLLALFFVSVALGMSSVLMVRFVMKDIKSAALYLPSFIFNIYAYLCALCIAMAN